MEHLTKIDATFYRMIFVAWADQVLAPARAPEGRFHYDGQKAMYLSVTPEGCDIATQRYRKSNDAERVVCPLHVKSKRIVDLRDPEAVSFFGVDVTHRAAEWQPIRATGARSPTWGISDHVRQCGLDGMLYASRSNPSLTHLTLFQWNSSSGTTIKTTGAMP